jgi:hypothetical protein
MSTSTKNLSDFFYRTLAAVAIGAPVLLTLAVSQLPKGTERNEIMLYGLGAVMAVLVTALVLRAAYTLGFNKALRIASSEPNRSVTADVNHSGVVGHIDAMSCSQQQDN